MTPRTYDLTTQDWRLSLAMAHIRRKAWLEQPLHRRIWRALTPWREQTFDPRLKERRR